MTLRDIICKFFPILRRTAINKIEEIKKNMEQDGDTIKLEEDKHD